MNSDKPVYVKQTRKGAFVDDGVKYSIATTVTINPDYIGDSRVPEFLLNMFVNAIGDPEDPTTDSFANYATLADLDIIPADRQSALSKGLTHYRDNHNIVSFDNLSVATTAAKIIRDTLNNVVDTYLRVNNEFIGSDTHYFPYPEEVSSLRDQFINEYRTARDSRVAAEEAQSSAQSASDLSEAIREVKASSKNKICNISDKLAGMNTLLQVVGSKYVDTLSAIIDVALANSDQLIADPNSATVLANLKTYIQSDSVRLGLVFDSSFTSEVDTAGTGLALLSGIAQVSSLALSECHTASIELSSAVADADSLLSQLKDRQTLKQAASEAEEAALAQLTTYCPGLDPSSI